MNEIGGILMGIGIDIAIALRLGNSALLSVILLVALLSGLGVLVYEQKKWNKVKKGRVE